MKTIIVLGIVLCFSAARAEDKGFRFVEGKCAGYNPQFVGPCGDLRKFFQGQTDLNHQDLRGALLDGSDLSFSNLTATDFRGASLEMVNLELVHAVDAKFNGVKANSASFTGASLSGADFSGGELEKTTFTRATADNAVFASANLKNAVFDHTNLALTDFRGAHLEDANLPGATLAEALGEGVNLSRAILTGANLELADLSEANLDHADFTGANLRAVRLRYAHGNEVQFANAILRGADFTSVHFRQANFKTARLERVDFEAADLERADFRGAGLNEAKMAGADLKASTFDEETALPILRAEAERQGMVFNNVRDFVGIKENVLPEETRGWRVCYRSTYSYRSARPFAQVIKNCPGRRLMLGCKKRTDAAFRVMAIGERATIFSRGKHDSNRAQFYWEPTEREGRYEFGFAPVGEEIKLGQNCDTARGSKRLCWFEYRNQLAGGGRCGASRNLLSDVFDWEMWIFVTDT